MGYAGLVAFGPQLCREAITAGRCANETHLLLHEILTDMLREDIGRLPAEALRTRMERRFWNEMGQRGAHVPD